VHDVCREKKKAALVLRVKRGLWDLKKGEKGESLQVSTKRTRPCYPYHRGHLHSPGEEGQYPSGGKRDVWETNGDAS